MRYTLRLRPNVVALALLQILVAGCIVPFPAPKRARVSPGTSRTLDLSNLKIGATTLEETARVLMGLETDASNARFVWARWEESSSGIAYFVGGGYSGTGDARRLWKIKNFLATFDDSEVLTGYTFSSDDELVPNLLRLGASKQRADPAGQYSFRSYKKSLLGEEYSGTVSMQAGKLIYRESGKPDFVVSLSAVRAIRAKPSADAHLLQLPLQFHPGTHPPNHLVIEATPLEALQILSLLDSYSVAIDR